MLVAGPYRWEARDIRGYGVQTNRFTFGAYRAPGAPTAAFALESLLDELAGKLGLDPFELRLKNAVVEGDIGVSGNPFPTIGAVEVLERLREHPLWAERDSLPEDEGIGMAAGYWPGGNEPASAVCRVDPDGTMTVVTSAVDMSGVNTGFAAIAAEAFGLVPESVRVVSADTMTRAVRGGERRLEDHVHRRHGRAACGRGRAPEAAHRRVRGARDLARRPRGRRRRGAGGRRPGPLDHGRGARHARRSASAAATSRSRGTAARRRPWAPRPWRPTSRTSASTARRARSSFCGTSIAQDVGRALNPALVEGQMRGGATQGIGWALFEELAHDEDGRLLTGSFLTYAIPVAERVPEIDTIIVEVPAPDGPYGAKGIGEAPVVAAPAAIANAVAAAAGVRMHELPMTAPRVWAALRGERVTSIERARVLVETYDADLRAELPDGARLFDAHTHLGDDIDGMHWRYEELDALLDRYGFEGAFVFCLDEPDREPGFSVPNDRTLAYAARSGGKLMPFVRLDLTQRPLEEARSRARPRSAGDQAPPARAGVRARRRAPAADLRARERARRCRSSSTAAAGSRPLPRISRRSSGATKACA